MGEKATILLRLLPPLQYELLSDALLAAMLLRLLLINAIGPAILFRLLYVESKNNPIIHFNSK